MDFKTDGHVHTRYCGHAIGEMEDYVKAAIVKGLKRLIFLEHLEVGINYFESTWLSLDQFRVYWQEGLALKKKYSDQISVKLGVEVGYNPNCILEINQFLRQFSWDRIGLSFHFYPYSGSHINMLSKKQKNIREFSRIGVGKVLDGYFSGILEAVQNIPATVLCHLDAGLRYHPDYRLEARHYRLVDKILAELACRGIALEVNTSGVSLRGTPFPTLSIIEKAHGMGIELVVGSDAHKPEDVGRHFEKMSEYLSLQA